ncbi:hypothetical protein AwDysgo_18180 [Bacteroidales bacterium]|nr:hypothetical protein AwDysgo_18180 [Bacteroidales bacterium]
MVEYISGTKSKLVGISFYVEKALELDHNERISYPINIEGNVSKLAIDNFALSILPEHHINPSAHYAFQSIIPTFNAYGDMKFYNFYYFENVKLDTLSLYRTTFSRINRDDILYEMVGNGILGSNILAIGYWEFNFDKKYIATFNRENEALIEERTRGMLCVEKKINAEDLISLNFAGKDYDFALDLGFSGQIEIDNNRRNELLGKHPHQTVSVLRKTPHKTSIDSVYLFENMSVTLGEWNIDSCRVVNIASVDGNYLGAQFMQNFNFVLGYGEYRKDDKLYIERTKSDVRTKIPYISKFGFNIDLVQQKNIIHMIVNDCQIIGGQLKLDDELSAIDNGAFDLSQDGLKNKFIEYCYDKNSIELKIKRGNEMMDISLHIIPKSSPDSNPL